ncbi:MAG TPA: GNAT family N-acetyltransferase [Acidobacteriota bacterium]|nr:GNAT family N-acetyltransferase [Acidobacteriota bacterium]
MKTVRCTSSRLAREVIDRLNAASFFSSMGFAELWRVQGGREVFWVTQSEEQVLAVLSGVEFGRAPLTRFQAMPAGCYAELVTVADTDIDRPTVAQSTIQALTEAGYAITYLADYWSHLGPLPGAEASGCATVLVDITDPGWQPPDRKIQSEVRKAEREGIGVERFDARRHLDGFLSLAKATGKRHSHKPLYTERFFRQLAALAERDARIRWQYTEYRGEPVASHVNLVLGDTLLNWQVYSDRAFSFLKPNQYMLYTAAKKAAEDGMRYLSLGTSPPDADSLAAYKHKWGGSDHCYNLYRLKSRWSRLLWRA